MDDKTGQAVEFATVYINGTTNGTITTTEGIFELKNVSFPCEMVISHVGYQPKQIAVESQNQQESIIRLTSKQVDLRPVTVAEKNKREKNLQLFRRNFLGDDYFGQHASIKNEEVLSFHWEYETKRNPINKSIKITPQKPANGIVWAPDSSWIEINIPRNLRVSANEPLIIELPLLGYTLHFDLLDYSYIYDAAHHSYLSSYLGYHYYKPVPENKLTKKIIANRKLAYYHSSMHFFRSIYSNSLAENGYKIVEKESEEKITPIDMHDYTENNGKFGLITGLKDRMFYILYYANRKGNPINLNEKKGRVPLQSNIYFTRDTCCIMDNGTSFDQSMFFSSLIGAKKAGSSLPSDYQVSTE